ncbi:MAG: FadR family transcriptional regulator [Deltaproteobacteria bacterium]|nr:FadR family transcriptional regulator [Deltaproteobacteria bacterium]
MESLFKPIKNKKISEDIIDQIKTLILSKKLKPGDKLPSERELTVMFSVGRPTIREALRSLEMMDLIEVQQGRGSFVKDLKFGSYIETLKDNVSFMLLSNTVSLRELYGGRKLFEPGIAGLVARHRTEQDLRSLEQLVMDKRKALANGEKFIKLSAMFHRELSEMSRNKVVRIVMDFLLTLSPSARLRKFSHREFREMVAGDHERILKTIMERDEEGAMKEMERHLDNLASKHFTE